MSNRECPKKVWDKNLKKDGCLDLKSDNLIKAGHDLQEVECDFDMMKITFVELMNDSH